MIAYDELDLSYILVIDLSGIVQLGLMPSFWRTTY